MEHWKSTKLMRFMKRKFLVLFFSFFFFSICALFGTTNFRTAEEYFPFPIYCAWIRVHEIRDPLTNKAEFYLQKFDKTQEEMIISQGIITSRRLLGGPGSWPPRCTSKCGTCTPCRPVHVAVPPGTPVTAEYYPEAWRCKCGNRLYMP